MVAKQCMGETDGYNFGYTTGENGGYNFVPTTPFGFNTMHFFEPSKRSQFEDGRSMDRIALGPERQPAHHGGLGSTWGHTGLYQTIF